MFNKKTVKDIDFTNKRVVMRADLDVPWDDQGMVMDDFRINDLIPTLEYLLNQNASVVIIGHRGRPKQPELKTSTEEVAKLLDQKISATVKFVDDAGGGKSIEAAKELKPGEVLVCQNLRFYGEKDKPMNVEFAKNLSKLGEYFVQNAFSNSHRNHASMVGINQFLPSVAGFSIEREVIQLSKTIENPEHPVLAITGGAKLETKLPLLEKFMKLADQIVCAGVMANTLLVAQGYSVGKSVYDQDEIDKAKEMLELAKQNGVSFVLPNKQVAVGKSLEDTNRRDLALDEIANDDLILDFGDESIAEVLELINQARTIIWNGPLGYYENPVFAKGSQIVARTIAKSSARSVVGGGDTADVINSLGLASQFTHVSTGGGASLELLAGHKLPAVEALLDK
ncbi:phosphoglycerate kinase [Candidatus Saccharibacteria bacterium]|nr:phosphoglycerate kinase [Candidatus Saccharibacteria bacterium]